MILGSLLLLSGLAHYAASALIDLRPTASNRIIRQCFNPGGRRGIGETNLRDCREALLVLARTPDFTTPKTYSKNPRRGHPVPLGWGFRECLIMVSCDNDRDAYTFRFADVLVVAKRIVDNCVGTVEDPRWGLLRWGGVDELGSSGTFYAAVLRPDPDRLAEGVIPVRLLNGTLFDPAVETS